MSQVGAVYLHAGNIKVLQNSLTDGTISPARIRVVCRQEIKASDEYRFLAEVSYKTQFIQILSS